MLSSKIFSAPLLLVIFIVGCAPIATNYSEAGSGQYGYRDLQVGDSVFRVSFAGNSLTKSEQVERYALYRAAEVALANGATHFEIVDGSEGVDTRSGSSFQANNTANVTHEHQPVRSILPNTTTAEASSSVTASSWSESEHTVVRTIQIHSFAGSSGWYDARLIRKNMKTQLEQEQSQQKREQNSAAALQAVYYVAAAVVVLVFFSMAHH